MAVTSKGLTPGTKVRLDSGAHFVIDSFLGRGGFGTVYRGTLCEEQAVLKVLHKGANDVGNIIREQAYNPAPDPRIAWPIDGIYRNSKAIVYAMLYAGDGYLDVNAWISGRAKATFETTVTFALGICELFQKLHSKGLAYRDVSQTNILGKPQTGAPFLIDPDNISSNSDEILIGTPLMIAPEVLSGHASPSSLTDLFSLSIILFQLLCKDFPFHGLKSHGVFDDALQDKLARSPVFIFDPKDRSNQATVEVAGAALYYWPRLPEFIRDMFVQCFTEGIGNPDRRVREAELIERLTWLKGLIARCDKCGAEVFCEPLWGGHGTHSVTCPNAACGRSQTILRLTEWQENQTKLTGASRDREVVLYPGKTLSSLHLGGKRRDWKTSGEVFVGKQGRAGLRNLEKGSWTVSHGSHSLEVKPGQGFVLNRGVKVRFSNGVESIIA